MAHALTRSSSGPPASTARRLAWTAALLISAGAAHAGDPVAQDRDRATAVPAVPAMLRLAVAQSRAAEVGPNYHVDRDGRGANPRHGFKLAFTPEGARIAGDEAGIDLRLERFGRGDGRPVRRAAPRIDGAWVEYERGRGLTEWFVNLPGGVEQGWTVARRPAGGGPLVLELDTARPPDRIEEGRLAWSGLVYHRLVAIDASGRRLPSAWIDDGARLRIEVDDRNAAYPVLIDPWVEQAKLTAADGAAGDAFGFSVALAGDTALVGALVADVGGNVNQGAVYVFTESGGVWSQQAKLTAADGATDDAFGASVSLAGDTALVGAFGADVGGNADLGAAYVFTESGGVWSQQAKLTAADGAADDVFGISVALADDTALVGAYLADVGGNLNQGAAYVFTESGGVWSQQAKLTAADGAADGGFGNSVALAGDSALVGAFAADVGGNPFQGAAYVFTESGGVWSQQAKLTADDGAVGDEFGASVSLAGESALVGVPGADVGGNSDQGAAYVFTESGGVWSQQAKLTADDGAVGDEFGASVSLADESALVGVPGADVGGNPDQGAAYVYTNSGGVWSQQAKLTADDGAADDRSGGSVALAGVSALVGSSAADVGGNLSQGAAYVYAALSAPVSLAVDPMPFDSDGNDVLEPGELVDVTPTWRNDGLTTRILSGSADHFTGAPGPAYTLWLDEAHYGSLEPLATASCAAFLGECYAVSVGSGARPALHWDATANETLTDGTSLMWTLHIGDSFGDVPRTHLFYDDIEAVLHHGITTGCAGGDFCPSFDTTRAEMAVFVLRAKEGRDYAPPVCIAGTEAFSDVPFEHPFCPWIEELFNRGVVAGCDGDNYCPGAAVTRAQMAVFLLRTLEGVGYTPPSCAGLFDDVACPSPFADWIEDLVSRGITAGCGAAPPRYCPGSVISRGQSAVFQSKTFDKPLYGP